MLVIKNLFESHISRVSCRSSADFKSPLILIFFTIKLCSFIGFALYINAVYFKNTFFKAFCHNLFHGLGICLGASVVSQFQQCGNDCDQRDPTKGDVKLI